jgi:3-dehydroquinate synthetase
MREGFQQVRGEINDLRTEFRAVMFRVGGGVMVGLLGVIAAILARGA